MTEADRPRVRVIFIGTGTFAVPALRALAVEALVGIAGIVTAPVRPAGRGGPLRPSPVSAAAAEAGLGPILTPERLRSPDAVAAVLALRPDLIVLADYGQIVPRPLLEVRHGALNLHPSLLPRHRGASPIPATILAGDHETGVAVMHMDHGLDTGPLVAVDDRPLHGVETASQLEADLAERGAALLIRSLGPWIRGGLAPRAQAPAGATLTRPLRRDDGRVDPRRAAVTLERQVRAFDPWPGTWFEVPSGRIVVLRAVVVPADGAVGDLVRFGRGVALITADAGLELLEVQPAGKRSMSGEELLRGRPGLLQERVEPPSDGLDPGPIERPVG